MSVTFGLLLLSVFCYSVFCGVGLLLLSVFCYGRPFVTSVFCNCRSFVIRSFVIRSFVIRSFVIRSFVATPTQEGHLGEQESPEETENCL